VSNANLTQGVGLEKPGEPERSKSGSVRAWGWNTPRLFYY